MVQFSERHVVTFAPLSGKSEVYRTLTFFFGLLRSCGPRKWIHSSALSFLILRRILFCTTLSRKTWFMAHVEHWTHGHHVWTMENAQRSTPGTFWRKRRLIMMAIHCTIAENLATEALLLLQNSMGRMCILITNGLVVPHFPLLCKAFNAHIDVEFCSSVQSIKYVTIWIGMPVKVIV